MRGTRTTSKSRRSSCTQWPSGICGAIMTRLGSHASSTSRKTSKHCRPSSTPNHFLLLSTSPVWPRDASTSSWRSGLPTKYATTVSRLSSPASSFCRGGAPRSWGRRLRRIRACPKPANCHRRRSAPLYTACKSVLGGFFCYLFSLLNT